MIDASPRAAWLFSRAAALGQFRRDVPIEPWYAAGITVVRHEDCGPCTQLGVTMAERAGVSPAVLRAVVSLAFAITAARIYPTVKYALGHGKACTRVVVGGTPVMFDHGRVPAP